MFNATPPVHPNCRCVIGPDEVWTDAGDARVCPYCMTLGAAWNLSRAEPPGDQEIEAILDRQIAPKVKERIARDTSVANALVQDAAKKFPRGLVADVVKETQPELERRAATLRKLREQLARLQALRGAAVTPAVEAEIAVIKKDIKIASEVESLTVAVEREATRRVSAARAAAPLQAGHIVPGIGELTEPVWFEPAPFGRKAPVTAKSASVLMVETPTHIMVRKAGRYYIRTLGGKALASDDNLALALLILLALVENERRNREERERGTGPTGEPRRALAGA